MGLSTTDIREIKSTILSTFNEKFLQEIANQVASKVEKQFEEKCRILEGNMKIMEERVQKLEEENKILRTVTDDVEQSQRCMNVRIFGVPFERSENTREKIVNLFNNKLNSQISTSDILKCYRVSSKQTDSDKPPAVLVRFANEAGRLSVLKNRKNLKNSGVQIKEDLTKSRLLILQKCADKFSYKNTWVLNGNIYVNKNGVVHRISSESDLLHIE